MSAGFAFLRGLPAGASPPEELLVNRMSSLNHTWLASLWLLLVACDDAPPLPRFVKELVRGGRVRWVDSTLALQLVTRRASTGFITEDKFVFLERFRARLDDSAYVLNTCHSDNTYSIATYVHGATLYIYTEAEEARAEGWN